MTDFYWERRRAKIIKLVWLAIAYALICTPAFAQLPVEKPEIIEDQLFNRMHTEYQRRCLTTIAYNCAAGNDDYVPIEEHPPTVADTLDWIGHQLQIRKLVHRYKFEGCKVAIDMTDGAPAFLTWLEEKDGNTIQQHRSIFAPEWPDIYQADWFAGNGYYIYLKANHRDNGTAQSPKRVMYSNDAALIDLTKIRDTKDHVVRDDKGNLVLRDAPQSSYRLNFYEGAEGQFIGTHFEDERTMLTKGSSFFPKRGKTLNIFDSTYVPFDQADQFGHFSIMLTADDVDFALKIAKAFRHVIELCELKYNKQD